MKQYSIGRSDECQIRIYDNSQRVSRHHATLKLLDNGKIFITDLSSNGTFVNGIKISPNVDFPVKRGDSISFANVAELNWSEIPKKKNKVLLYFAIGLTAVILCLLTCFLITKERDDVKPAETNSIKTDTTKNKPSKADTETKIRINDSLQQLEQDSTNKTKTKEKESSKQNTSPKVKKKDNTPDEKKPQKQKTDSATLKMPKDNSLLLN